MDRPQKQTYTGKIVNNKVNDVLTWVKNPHNVTLDAGLKVAQNTAITAWNTFKIRASDLDQLFPWMLLSIGINTVVWLTVLFGFAAPLVREHHVVTSTVEIHLGRVLPQPQPASVAHQSIAHVGQYVVKHTTHNQSTAATEAVRKTEYNAYLRGWESRIMQIAQKKLFSKTSMHVPQGKVITAVTIAPDGHLLQITILHPSHSVILNFTVRKLIVEAAPFAALPSIWQSPPTPLRIVRTWNFA